MSISNPMRDLYFYVLAKGFKPELERIGEREEAHLHLWRPNDRWRDRTIVLWPNIVWQIAIEEWKRL